MMILIKVDVMLPPTFLTEEHEKTFKEYLDENINNQYPYEFTEKDIKEQERQNEIFRKYIDEHNKL